MPGSPGLGSLLPPWHMPRRPPMAIVDAPQRPVQAMLQLPGLHWTPANFVCCCHACWCRCCCCAPLPPAAEVDHPDDPAWHVVQGTFLPASVADDLEAMQNHRELHAAEAALKGIWEAARAARGGLLERASVQLPVDVSLEDIEPALLEVTDSDECRSGVGLRAAACCRRCMQLAQAAALAGRQQS